MATIPAYIHIGDEVITGGENLVAPATTFPQLAGLATMMIEYQRVVPSGPDGINGGSYFSYYDGTYVKPWQASAGGASTISIATAQWKVNHHTGRTVTITAGTGSGQSRTVASNTTTQITTTVAWTTPPDATSVFNLGAGEVVMFHYIPGVLIPGANGDNWFQFPRITPTGMLMQRLGQLYNNQAPGFRFLKVGAAAGVGGFATGGGSGYTALSTHWGNLKGIEEGLGNTLDCKAVIVDAATTDIFGANLNFATDIDNLITTIRTEISATALIIFVSPHYLVARTSLPPMAPAVRDAIRAAVTAKKAAGDPNIALFDMSWGEFTWNAGGSNTVLPADPRYYDLPTVIQTGIGLFNVIRAHYAPPVTEPLGRALAGVVMLSDSQFVGTGRNPLMAFYADQPSMVGTNSPSSNTTKSNVWIWDDAMQQMVLYDVMSNSNTYGATGWMGPDVTLPRKLLKRYPQGVVIFKYARGGISLTAEGGGPVGYIETGSPTLEDIKEKWTKCRVSCLQETNRSLDAIGIAVSMGENDAAAGEVAITAFENRASDWVDDVRDIFTTRVDGVTPWVWMQGPPPATEVTGGSIHSLPVYRNRYRAKLLAIEAEKEKLTVIRNNGPDDFELSRDQIHYGGETLWKIGDRIAEELLALIDSGSAVGGVDDGGEDSEDATDGPEDDSTEESSDSPSSGGTDAPEPTAEQQASITDAMYSGVRRYRTATGMEVEMHDLDKLRALRAEDEARAAAPRRIRQTLVRFD